MTLEPPSDLQFFNIIVDSRSLARRHNFSHPNYGAGTHRMPDGSVVLLSGLSPSLACDVNALVAATANRELENK